MNKGQKIRSKKNMKALDRAKVKIPVWARDNKGVSKPVGFSVVTNMKAIRL